MSQRIQFLEGTVSGLANVIRGTKELSNSGFFVSSNVVASGVTSLLRGFLAQALNDVVPKYLGMSNRDLNRIHLARANAFSSRMLSLKSADCFLRDFLVTVEKWKRQASSVIITRPTTLSPSILNLRNGSTKLSVMFRTFKDFCVEFGIYAESWTEIVSGLHRHQKTGNPVSGYIVGTSIAPEK